VTPAVTTLAGRLLATDITVGDHLVRKIGPFTINVDTVWSTLAAAAIVLILGFIVRARATPGTPGKLQLLWETIVSAVRTQVEGSIGPRGEAIIPLAVVLFIFILIINWFAALGIGSRIEWLPPATGDINLTLALALIVIIPVHVASVRVRGWGGYLSHYASQPFPKVLFPANIFINVVEELAKPITLALRLFGNLLSSGLMLVLIAALGVWTIGSLHIGYVATLIADVLWKIFDAGLIAPIQAFIFALLTILYFDTAMAGAEAH
jgi:F-type H+-transporting ATPase subunit a